MNDDRKYQLHKDSVLELLKMGMPNKVVQACLKLSPATVHNYAAKLREEKVWNGKNSSIIEAIPRMIAMIAFIEFNRIPLSWMKLSLINRLELFASLNEVLETQKMINIIDHASRHLAKLRRFGFHQDIPEGYRDFLNAFNPQHEWPQINGETLWREYLRKISHQTEIEIGTESLATWQDKTIDLILDEHSGSFRHCIAPVFPFEICQRIDDLLLPTLNTREVNIVKMYYGIGEVKLSQKEIGNRLNVSSTVISQIINRTLRRIKHLSRLELILALPLTWETVSKIIADNTPPRPKPFSDCPVTPEEASLFRVVDLDFSVRTLNIFYAADISILKDLLEFSESDLYKFRNMGRKSIIEVQAVLKKYKLALRESTPAE